MQVIPITTITSKGQVTIPQLLRQKLELQTGDKVAFELDKEGIRLKPMKMSLRSVYQSIPPLPKKLSVKKMREIAIEEKIRAAG